MLERAFRNALFLLWRWGSRSLMGATRPASVESVGLNSLFLLFPTRDASPPLVLEFYA